MPELQTAMVFEAAQSKQVTDEWVVEAINYAGDGEIYAALFSGPQAEDRAHEYAKWKNNSAAL